MEGVKAWGEGGDWGMNEIQLRHERRVILEE